MVNRKSLAEVLEEALEKSKSSSRSVHFPFLPMLAILFITLKLTNVIAWSWWWVLAPLWLPLAIVLGIAFILIIIALCLK